MKKTTCIILTIVLTLGLLAGCGGMPQEEGAVFRIGGISIDTLNPWTTYVAGTMELLMLMHDSLVRVDENYDPVPCLAESWEVDEDGLVWTFNLIKNATWHDGEPLTSADVKFTYDTMIDYDLGYAYSTYLTGIESISCPDDYTVVMETSTVKANMLMNQTPILPMHIWGDMDEDELYEDLNEHPIGSGPFKFHSKSKADDYWTLVRNDDYWGPKPYIDSLVFIYYANTDSMTQSLKLGEIDAIYESEVSQLATLGSDPNIDVISAKIAGFSQIGINVYEEGNGNPLLRDINVRHAMEYALDREKIKEMAFFGAGEIGSTILSEIFGWHYKVPESEFRSYDLDKANAILDAAGYTDRNAEGTRLDKDGNPLEFNMIYNADEASRIKVDAFLQAGCKEIGIKINSKSIDGNAVADAIAEYDYDLFMWAWYEELDPTPMLAILTEEELFMNNETGWTNERYDELYYLQQEILDYDERLAMVHEMQKMAYDGCPYILLMYDEVPQAIRSDRWTGYKQIPEEGGFFVNITYDNYMNIRPVE